MIYPRPVAFAQPDQEHLHQPAFDLSHHKTGVRLHAVADQHVIGLEGRPIKTNSKPSAARATTTVSVLDRMGQPTNVR